MLLVFSIIVVAILVWFPISFGSHEENGEPQVTQDENIPEQSLKLDSLQSLIGILRDSKGCSFSLIRSRGRANLDVKNLNDKTDLLGKDWLRLVGEYKSKNCQIRVDGTNVYFQFEIARSGGVEYVTIPIHVLHALAELKAEVR
jgi:hypothetical protein